MRILIGLLALSLASCTQFPEIDAANRAAEPTGAPPPLLAFTALEAATTLGASPAAEVDDLAVRAAALRRRAAILRQPTNDIEALEAMRARLAAR